jgi:hypothetical protein
MQNKKRRKSTILVGRFAGPGGGPPVGYQAHRPTEGVQDYDGSHWLLSSGHGEMIIGHSNAALLGGFQRVGG